ncbi:low temperature requirement protein A [Rheinheimera sp.]|uniref:low temperature requirement protein A n=1 Tax=Rheinheimera sp. TaxID=1869214 RepID=UPI003D2DD00B
MQTQWLNKYWSQGIRAMPPRDVHEHHRASTPLELLFDLVAVIAIAAAAGELHHAVAHGHALEGAGKFVLAFFAIWWAWMNFSWFASAYDNDDAIFRVLTMGLMMGSLTMSAGIAPFFQQGDLQLIVLGFVWMRLCMVLLWLRASRHHPALRRTTLTYALGLVLVQCYWVGLMLAQPLSLPVLLLLFAFGAVLELAVPAIAERQGITPWHRHHMMERYGLLNLIVLGETLLAGSVAISQLQQLAQSTSGFLPLLTLGLVPLLAMILLFCLWWLYFSREEHLQQQNLRMALTWGYGHLLIYAAGAAVGAGIAVQVDLLTGKAHISNVIATGAVALPVALYLFGLWLVRDRFVFRGASRYLLLGFAVALPPISLFATGFGPIAGLLCITLCTLLAVLLRSSHACCQAHHLSVSGVEQ